LPNQARTSLPKGVRSVTFGNPAAQRAARRSGALAGLGLFWVTLLVSLGLIWLALGAVVATVVGVAVVLGVTWHPHVDLRRRRTKIRRRVKAVDESIGRALMAGGARTRAATRTPASWTRHVKAVDEAIGRRLMAGGVHARAGARTSAAWAKRAGARAGAATKSASSATASAAAAGTKAASAKTVSGASAAREWTRSHPLPRSESPVPSLREATTYAVSHVPSIELPRRRPRAQGHKLAHDSVVARREGRVDDAVALGREAVEAFREADDRRGEALALNTLALALAQDHRYAEAVDALDGAITLLGELGDRHREGTVLVNLGTLHRQAGGVESARFCWRKALERLDPASPESHETERLLRAS
jgi:tetratricopeptide (TPR) repeat protein